MSHSRRLHSSSNLIQAPAAQSSSMEDGAGNVSVNMGESVGESFYLTDPSSQGLLSAGGASG